MADLAGEPGDPLRTSPPPDSSLEARCEVWEVVLDRLELDVIRVERALEQGAGLPRRLDEWYEPSDYGPVPEPLRARAGQVLERQQAALAQLAAHLGVTAQHQALLADVDRLDPGRDARPVYVDVSF